MNAPLGCCICLVESNNEDPCREFIQVTFSFQIDSSSIAFHHQWLHQELSYHNIHHFETICSSEGCLYIFNRTIAITLRNDKSKHLSEFSFQKPTLSNGSFSFSVIKLLDVTTTDIVAISRIDPTEERKSKIVRLSIPLFDRHHILRQTYLRQTDRSTISFDK